ncbi:phosphatidylinositol 3-and 4-kinase family protein [Stylonychia lemnae]|uniref:Phosphatidylinositol 3-and 4-kinase family protein n=1 Tax=Stylonychia lemnae TaxID=5949 RepID=A0A078ATR1_STYLE|nr:phosphatidylinositol 3-and 4-kinase family protein [Stylonychia lemnae]|eukprot:CDW85366.1 phosphatidylinositol 3-and 4-kinase family protein [Stylonychia lemnae]
MEKQRQEAHYKHLAESIKRQQRGVDGQNNAAIMTFNSKYPPQNQQNNSIIQEAQSSQMETSSRMYTSRRTTVMTSKDPQYTYSQQRATANFSSYDSLSVAMQSSQRAPVNYNNNNSVSALHNHQAFNPLKSTTSAKTFISNTALTPILRSARNKGNGADSEELKDFTHTEFTETVNDEDYEDDDLDIEQDSQSNESSVDEENEYNQTHVNLLEYTQNLNSNHSQSLWGYYVLFLDPENFIYYRKDPRRDDYIVLEPIVDEHFKEKFLHANKIHLYKIRKLLVLEGFSWNFKGEADMYRRRPFPRQFLQNEASDYPCYVFQSELSKAFNNKGEIDTVVDLLEYKQQMYNEGRIQNMDQDLVITFNESLVNSTKEFIKNILRQVYGRYGFKIKPKPNYNLILKADGYREYFEGNYQLLQYERVRTCLRKNEKMKLLLTEIPNNYRDRKFPPIFKTIHEIPPANTVNTSSQSQFNKNPNSLQSTQIQNQYNSNLSNTNNLTISNNDPEINSSPYFWYPPVQNIKMHYEKLVNKRQQNHQNSNMSMMMQSQQQDKNLRRVVYVAPEKNRVSLTEHRHQTGGTTTPKQNEQIVLLSGECNWRFKFKLVGIERLNVIFNEIKQRVATDNLNTEPRNVTLKPQKLQYRKHQGKKQEEIQINPNEGSQMTVSTASVGANPSGSVHQNDPSTRTQSLMRFFKKNKQPAVDREEEKKLKTTNQKKLKVEEEIQSQKYDYVPTMIKKTIKMFHQKDKNDEFKFKKKKHGHGHDSKHEFTEDEEHFLTQELQKIHTPYCNFGNKYDTIINYQNILSSTFSKCTPLKLVVECTLFHGCETLTQSVHSEEAYFNNTVRYNQWINFGNLRYCQIPMKTRLSFNIIMLTKEGQQLTIGCVSLNLFDEKGRFRNGLRELNVWPFYELDERLGCMKEYNGITVSQAQSKDFHKQIDSLFTKLLIEFEGFNYPFYYSSRDEKKIDFYKLSTNYEDREDKANLINVQVKNQDLAKLKRYLNQNPLTKFDDTVKRELFKCREHYQTHPQGLPIFLRSVQWNRPIQVNEVYKMLQNWALMKPEEAISLLDAKFPDERVRKYAVARISQLSDDDLALYMLQFSQALLFEEQHFSHLAEMLIERSLKNPYVVGHAFYWSLKSNLYLKPSYERYYVLLEQFLMLCGKFKEEIWIQQKVNTSLKTVSENVVANRYKEKIPFADVKEKARYDLRNQRRKLPFLFTLTIDPKIVIRDFNYERLTVFSSKKVPLLITCLNQQPGGDPLNAIFKNGDDLRQDILTLQIIYIMDKIWLANNLDLAMTPYKVMGTDCEQGYLEFVGNCKTLAYIQYKRSIFNTFSDDTIEKYMTHYLGKKYPDDWSERLENNRKIFIKSTAGYCVASYVLGLGDRHPDNIMINREEGNYLHVDFGHFLGNVKKKFGVKRERDPFVFSKELAYFINGGPLNKNTSKIKISKKLSEEEHRDLSESILSLDQNERSIISKGSEIDESMKSQSFKDFEDMCCQAYNILRKDGHQLINMFLIMLSAGMPELKKDDDIQFMVNRLDLSISEQEASNKFKKEIQRAMQTYSRRFDNFLHNIKAKFSK